MKRSLDDLGERKIIEELRIEIPFCKNNLLGTDDDSAVYNLGLAKHLVIHTDRIPISYGIRYGIVDFFGFGKYFAGAVINDVIAKGGKPFGLMVALECPLETQLVDLHSFYKGINDLILKHDINIIGGDTKQGNSFDVVGTAIGLVDREYYISRKGALEGDVVAVTGPLGLFGANVYSALVKKQIPDNLKAKLKSAYNDNLRIPFEVMNIVTSSRSADASLDVSDGLFGDLNKIARLSNVGIEIDYEKIPFHEYVLSLAQVTNADPARFVRIGGDLQIALTIKKEKWTALKEKIKREKLKLHEIGRVVAGNGITIIRDGERTKLEKVPEWEWFRGITMESLLFL